MQDTVRGTKIFRRTLRLLHVRYGDLCRFGQAAVKMKRLKKLYITGITSGADKKMTVTGAIATIKTNVLLKWLHLHTV